MLEVFDKLTDIMDNRSLYGHYLTTTLPEKAWNFATSLDGREYMPLTADSSLTDRIFRNYRDTTVHEGRTRIFMATDFLCMQAIATKVVGNLLFTVSLTTAALGLVIKVIHLVGLQLTNRQLTHA